MFKAKAAQYVMFYFVIHNSFNSFRKCVYSDNNDLSKFT